METERAVAKSKSEDPFFIEFPTGEVITFRREFLKYFTKLNKQRAQSRGKQSTFPFLGNYGNYVKLWRIVFLIYREHDALHGNTRGPNTPIKHSETLDRVLKSTGLMEMYDLITILYTTGANLILDEVIKVLVNRLLPMSIDDLYLIHEQATRPMVDDETVNASNNPIHRLNKRYYTKLATLDNIFQSYLRYNDLRERVMSFMPQTLSVTACGETHSMFILPGGLFACGDNRFGQLGLDPSVVPNAVDPIKVPLSDKYEIIQVKCSAHHTMILTTNGLYTCGSNYFGQLGLNKEFTPIVWEPERVDLDNIIDFACHNEHSIIVTRGGAVYGTGSNLHSQLGLGGELFDSAFGVHSRFYSPMKIQFPGKDVIDIVGAACGMYHTLFWSSDGRVYACGDNSSSQLGIPVSDDGKLYHIEPIEVPFEDEKKFTESGDPVRHVIVSVSCGDEHSAVLTDTGNIHTFGANSSSQRGYGNKTRYEMEKRVTTVKEYVGEKREVVKMSGVYCCANYTMMLSVNRVLYGCGSNRHYGQLGVGGDSTVDVYTPAAIQLQDVLSVSCGPRHITILTSEALYMCGKGDAVGLGSKQMFNSPVILFPISEITSSNPREQSVLSRRFM